MKKTIFIIIGLVVSFILGYFLSVYISCQSDKCVSTELTNNSKAMEKPQNLKLGAFSISLSVKDIKVSKQFYENVGFTVFAGDIEKKYLIMKNENALIGLFQGMFENNILTFNPGWDENAQNLEKFDDVRLIQEHLKSKGVKIENEIKEPASGPASFMVTDPDGNVILFDQHR